jgi:hypothetical protein
MAKDKSKKKYRAKPQPDKEAPDKVTISGPSEVDDDWDSGTEEWALTLEGDSQGLDDLFDDLSSDDSNAEDLADLDSIEAALEQITQSVFGETEAGDAPQEQEPADSDIPDKEEALEKTPDSSSAYFEQIQNKMSDLLNLNFDSIEIEGLSKEEEVPPPPSTTEPEPGSTDTNEDEETGEIEHLIAEADEGDDIEPDEPLILDESHWIPDDTVATSDPQDTVHELTKEKDVGTLADLMAEIEAEIDEPVGEVPVTQVEAKSRPQEAAIPKAIKAPEDKTSTGIKPQYIITVIVVIAAAYFGFEMLGDAPEPEVQLPSSNEVLTEQTSPNETAEEETPVVETAAVVTPEETTEETALSPGERIATTILSDWAFLDGWIEEALQPSPAGINGGQPLEATIPQSLEHRYQHLSLNRSAYNLLNLGIENGTLDQFLNNAHASRARILQATIIELSELGYCEVAESELRNSRAAFDATDNLRDQLLNETQQSVFFCGQQRDSNTWDNEQIRLLTRQANRLDTLITGGSLNDRTSQRLDAQRLGTYHQLTKMLRIALKRNLIPSDQIDSASRAHYFFSLKLILELERREFNGAVTALINTVLDSELVPSDTDTSDLVALRDQLNEPATFDQIVYNDLMNQIAVLSTQLPAPQYTSLAANAAGEIPEGETDGLVGALSPTEIAAPAEAADPATPGEEVEEPLQEEDEHAGLLLVSINITSSPSRARIYHGEEVLGRTPYEDEIWVEPGDLQLRVSKSNYHSERLNLAVTENTSLSRSLTLRERESTPTEESGNPFGRTQTMGGDNSFGRTQTMGGE